MITVTLTTDQLINLIEEDLDGFLSHGLAERVTWAVEAVKLSESGELLSVDFSASLTVYTAQPGGADENQ